MTMARPRALRWNATALLALAFCTIWSSAFVVTKIGLTSAPPLTLATVRFLTAGPLMLTLAAILGYDLDLPPRRLLTVAAIGLCNNTLYLGLTFVALKTVSAGFVAVIASTNPLLISTLAYLVLAERMTLGKVIGLALGMVGVAIVLQHRLTLGIDDPAGILLAVLGVAALAAGTVLFKATETRSNLLVVNGLQVTIGGAALLPMAIVLESGQPAVFDANFLFSVVYLGLVVSVGGTFIWFTLLRRSTASAAGSYHFLNPVLGLLFGAAVVGETVSWWDLVGVIPIVGGILLITVGWEFKSCASRNQTSPGPKGTALEARQ
ncbi:MAG: EamA family transporter [Azospirillum sp.]|nr:EamA family transporter [Azospirillum sp.]